MKNKISTLIIFSIIIVFLCGYNTKFTVIECQSYYDQIISKGTKEEKIIALTFDDGPHPKYTNEILDLLNEYDAKATFFVLGKMAELYPDIIKRQWKEGHEIGNHTYSHINPNKVSKEELLDEYNKTQEIIASLTGSTPKLFRPPYGSFNKDIIEIVDMDHSIIVLWSANQDSKDWSNPKVENIVNSTLSNIENGDIILFHDYVYYKSSHTIEALKKILPILKSQGYRFVTVSELMNITLNCNN